MFISYRGEKLAELCLNNPTRLNSSVELLYTYMYIIIILYSYLIQDVFQKTCLCKFVSFKVQGGSNMTGTNCDFFTHN